MIIKKSDLNLVKVINNPPSEFTFGGEVDAAMLTNILLDKMDELGGVSLSANQVGLDLQVFVMGIKDVRMEFFNPKITSYSTDEVLMTEGSLFYPGMKLEVKRPSSITVEYYDKTGKHIATEFSGLTARIFQHEYDHMQGITLKEKVSKLKWDMAAKRFKNKKEKLIKKFTQKTLMGIKEEVARLQNGNS